METVIFMLHKFGFFGWNGCPAQVIPIVRVKLASVNQMIHKLRKRLSFGLLKFSSVHVETIQPGICCEPAFEAKKSRTTLYDFNEDIFGSPAFRLYGIRDLPPLPCDRFGIIINRPQNKLNIC